MKVIEEIEKRRPKLLEEFERRFPQLTNHYMKVERRHQQFYVIHVLFGGMRTPHSGSVTTIAFDEKEPECLEEAAFVCLFDSRMEYAFRDLEELLRRNELVSN